MTKIKKGFIAKTWRNSKPTKGEVNNNPSMTVPDMTLSMRELINRFTKGMEVPISNLGYDSDFNEEYPDISKMSKIEKVELAHQQKERVKTLRKDLTKQKSQKPTPPKETARKSNEAEPVAVSDGDPKEVKPTAEVK